MCRKPVSGIKISCLELPEQEIQKNNEWFKEFEKIKNTFLNSDVEGDFKFGGFISSVNGINLFNIKVSHSLGGIETLFLIFPKKLSSYFRGDGYAVQVGLKGQRKNLDFLYIENLDSALVRSELKCAA